MSTLCLTKKNPRKNDNAVKAVAQSIKAFGFKVPIVIDSTKVIVCGHTRFKAAKKLKLKSVSCIVADDLTPEQVKAFRLIDNKTAELAEWNIELLCEELKSFPSEFVADFNFELPRQEEISAANIPADISNPPKSNNEFETITFIFAAEQKEAVESALEAVADNIKETFGNKNKKGNALYEVVNNSSVHFGAFLDGKLHGVMSYCSSMDKSKIIRLVAGTEWNEFLELNRMAFDEYLPRNSESYSIAKSIRLIKRNAPHVKWIVSFADGCSCGDGKKIHRVALVAQGNTPRPELGGKTFFDVTGGNYNFKKYVEAAGGKLLDGYQFRYIYFIDKTARARLTVPEIPFSRIDELNAGMYRGEKISVAARHIMRE